MKTKLLSTEDPQAIPTAIQIIEDHGVIAFPTDTLYGVAADPFCPEALLNVYAAKKRPKEMALPVLIGDFGQLEQLVSHISDEVTQITKAFWPGALTLILPKRPNLPPDLSPYPTVGIRMPDLAFTLKLLQQTGPLATTSANISGGPNPTTADEVFSQLGGRIDLILDGGLAPGGTASTILLITDDEFKILRQGPLTLTDIKNAI